jgi:hypothetical protein
MYFPTNCNAGIVSTTDFSTIALALLDDAVSNAKGGDFVTVGGKIHIILKDSPTAETDFLLVGDELQ